MHRYHYHRLSKPGAHDARTDFEATNDQEALDLFALRLESEGMELWRGERKIARIAKGGAIIAL